MLSRVKSSPPLKIDCTNKIKKNISDDGLLKLSDRRNSESPSPNSVSDDSLFNSDGDGYGSSGKRVTFNSMVTVITENGNNSKVSSKKDDPNKKERKKKLAALKNLKLDKSNNKTQEECTVKGCSVDINDYMCVIS